MSNIVELPNGSSWDNDLAFREQEPMAQYWCFTQLKGSLIDMQYGRNPEQNTCGVTRGLMIGRAGKRVDPSNLVDTCYSILYSGDYMISCDKYYTYKDWDKLLSRELMVEDIDDSNFYNIDNWTFEDGIMFQVNLMEE